jgi:glycosyltransferase involved in cell wall biosynthesis
LIDPHQSEALAEAITRLLQDQALRQSLQEQGLEQASHFSWEHTAGETLAAYEYCARRN